MTQEVSRKSKYVATIGITLEDGTRLDPGDLYPGKPPRWLITDGHLVKADN